VEAWLIENQQQARLLPHGTTPDLSSELPGNLLKSSAIW
jgi:hypothetical protein